MDLFFFFKTPLPPLFDCTSTYLFQKRGNADGMLLAAVSHDGKAHCDKGVVSTASVSKIGQMKLKA
jgi:hypothetical protein